MINDGNEGYASVTATIDKRAFRSIGAERTRKHVQMYVTHTRRSDVHVCGTRGAGFSRDGLYVCRIVPCGLVPRTAAYVITRQRRTLHIYRLRNIIRGVPRSPMSFVVITSTRRTFRCEHVFAENPRLQIMRANTYYLCSCTRFQVQVTLEQLPRPRGHDVTQTRS